MAVIDKTKKTGPTRAKAERRLARATTVEECQALLSHSNKHVQKWALYKAKKLDPSFTP